MDAASALAGDSTAWGALPWWMWWALTPLGAFAALLLVIDVFAFATSHSAWLVKATGRRERIPGHDLCSGLRALRWATDFHHESRRLLLGFKSNVVRLWLGVNIYVCADADIYQEAFVSQQASKWHRPGEVLNDLALLKPLMIGSLFVLEDEPWAALRKRLSRGFHHSYLVGMVPSMQQVTANLVDKWTGESPRTGTNGTGEATEAGSLADPVEYDVMESLNALTLDVIGITAFGFSFGAVAGGHDSSAMMAHVSRVMQETTNPLAHIPGWSSLPTPFNRAMINAVEAIKAKAQHVVHARRAAYNKAIAESSSAAGAGAGAGGSSSNAESSHSGGKGDGEPLDAAEADAAAAAATAAGLPQDLLSLLMLPDPVDGSLLSDEAIVSNAASFLIAGQETTSIALTWTLWLLATHPDAQRRAQREADVLYARVRDRDGEGAKPLASDLRAKDLPECRAVLDESLRMYPPAAINARKVKVADAPGIVAGSGANDSGGGAQVRLPNGAWVMFSVWSLHRNPQYWSDPDEFRPERFYAENRRKIKRGSYVPFSVGPRHCVGAQFAQTEMLAVLPQLLRHFWFSPVRGFTPELSLNETLKPKHGMQLRVHRRLGV